MDDWLAGRLGIEAEGFAFKFKIVVIEIE